MLLCPVCFELLTTGYGEIGRNGGWEVPEGWETFNVLSFNCPFGCLLSASIVAVKGGWIPASIASCIHWLYEEFQFNCWSLYSASICKMFDLQIDSQDSTELIMSFTSQMRIFEGKFLVESKKHLVSKGKQSMLQEGRSAEQ